MERIVVIKDIPWSQVAKCFIGAGLMEPTDPLYWDKLRGRPIHILPYEILPNHVPNKGCTGPFFKCAHVPVILCAHMVNLPEYN